MELSGTFAKTYRGNIRARGATEQQEAENCDIVQWWHSAVKINSHE